MVEHMDRETRLRNRSEAARKGWVARKRMQAAREPKPDRGGALAPKPRSKPRVGYAAILAASTPDRSSTDVAHILGVHPAYVRGVWKLHNLPRREAGVHPRVRKAMDAAND